MGHSVDFQHAITKWPSQKVKLCEYIKFEIHDYMIVGSVKCKAIHSWESIRLRFKTSTKTQLITKPNINPYVTYFLLFPLALRLYLFIIYANIMQSTLLALASYIHNHIIPEPSNLTFTLVCLAIFLFFKWKILFCRKVEVYCKHKLTQFSV